MAVGYVDVPRGVIGDAEGIVQHDTGSRNIVDQSLHVGRKIAGSNVQIPTDGEAVYDVVVIIADVICSSTRRGDTDRIVEFGAGSGTTGPARAGACCSVSGNGVDIAANRELPNTLVVVVGNGN